MVRKQLNGIWMSITSLQMSGEIGEYGKLGENHYFEERLTKCNRGDREIKVDSELSLRELISWRMVAIIENKPTSLQSHFVGQDDVGCFKNMA